MDLDPNACYRALQTRDARFDGRFFVAVKTTGIYCRNICPARTARRENVNFFSSAAAAQEAGYRPCLRCRPEISPDTALWNGTSATVSRALDLIAEGALDGSDHHVEALASRLGIGERQLRRLFLEHVGVPPIAVAQNRRVHFAKQLIHDTQLSMTDIALASGFGSTRRFNAVFQQLFHRSPRELRRRRAAVASSGESQPLQLVIPYRPPYDWDALIRFLSARAIAGIEHVEPHRYCRTIAIDNHVGFIEITHQPQRSRLQARIAFPDVRTLPAIARRIGRVFDTRADIQAVTAHLAGDKFLASLIAARPGLRCPGGWDGFELAVRALLGQQITVAGARQLAARLTARFGESFRTASTAPPGLTHIFPTPHALAEADLSAFGVPRARAASLTALARAVVADPRLFDRAQSLDLAIEKLRTLPGIGDWTAHYIALRALRETDAFPQSDIGLLRALAVDGVRPSPAALLNRAAAWRPWRAYAAQHLWALDESLAKTPLLPPKNPQKPQKTRFLPPKTTPKPGSNYASTLPAPVPRPLLSRP